MLIHTLNEITGRGSRAYICAPGKDIPGAVIPEPLPRSPINRHSLLRQAQANVQVRAAASASRSRARPHGAAPLMKITTLEATGCMRLRDVVGASRPSDPMPGSARCPASRRPFVAAYVGRFSEISQLFVILRLMMNGPFFSFAACDMNQNSPGQL